MSERARMKSVVVATDFSPGGASAAARVAMLPLAPEAAVSLVHVLDAVPERFAPGARGRAEVALEEGAERLRRAARERGAGVRVEPALLAGKPHVEIVRHARARAADLVVLGRHGPAPLRDALVGTTAERVIRMGDVPVLLVKQEAAGPYGRALVAVDLSDASRRGIDLAASLLPDDVRELALVHACHVAFRSWLGEAALEEFRRELTDLAAHAMAALAATAPIACRGAVREGDPRVEVVDEAARDRADLLVVGTHGRSGVAHALVGSVAEWIVRTAPATSRWPALPGSRSSFPDEERARRTRAAARRASFADVDLRGRLSSAILLAALGRQVAKRRREGTLTPSSAIAGAPIVRRHRRRGAPGRSPCAPPAGRTA